MNYEMQKGLYKPGPDLIVLASEPMSVRLTALPFIAVGLFFMTFPFMVSEGTQMSIWPRLLFGSFGALGFLAGLQVYRLSGAQVLVDRHRNLIVLPPRILNARQVLIELSSVNDVKIEIKKDSEGGTNYRVMLDLKNGEPVPLNSGFPSLDCAKHERLRVLALLSDCGAPVSKLRADEIEAFTGKQGALSSIADSHNRAAQQKNAFRAIGIALAMIFIYPFAGWGIAAMEKQSEKIQAGVPSAEMSERLHRMGADKLPISEQILFVAAPEPGHQNVAKLSLTVFGIVWMIFSCAAAAGLVLTVRMASKGGALLGMIFTSPFILVGFWFLTLPYLLYKDDLHTIYAITPSRAVEFKAGTMHQIVRFDDSRFGPVELKPYSETRADLIFYASDSESSSVCDGFWGIEKAEMAKAILEEKLKAR